MGKSRAHNNLPTLPFAKMPLESLNRVCHQERVEFAARLWIAGDNSLELRRAAQTESVPIRDKIETLPLLDASRERESDVPG